MAKTLTRTVYVDGVAYGPTSAIPEDVAKRITNPKAWADADAPAPAPAGVVPAAAERPADEPPSAEWTVRELKDFAKAEGIALGDARAKDQILAVLADAGHAGPEGDDEGEDAAAADVPEADSPDDVDEPSADD
ncbi:hypothetical protein PQI65_15025 [Brachybacterium paraconglomeratum]